MKIDKMVEQANQTENNFVKSEHQNGGKTGHPCIEDGSYDKDVVEIKLPDTVFASDYGGHFVKDVCIDEGVHADEKISTTKLVDQIVSPDFECSMGDIKRDLTEEIRAESTKSAHDLKSQVVILPVMCAADNTTGEQYSTFKADELEGRSDPEDPHSQIDPKTLATAMVASPTTSVAAAASEATDGPVLSVISKRLRALRKKLNRITQMEESLAAGKTLQPEQEEVLRSKPVIVALIDELERLRTPLASAVAEELSSRPAPAPAAAPAASSSADADSSIQDLLALIYFGSLFDVKPQSEFVATMVARTHERSCCITYDYVTDDAADLLAETDLDAVSALASLTASRPSAAAGVSHRDALQACAYHARLWLRRAEEPIHPDSSITYAGVRAKLDRIMASDYYTAQATMDVAAAVANYAGGMPAQESMVVSPEAPAVEEGVTVEGPKDDKEDSQAAETYTEHQSPPEDTQQVDDEAPVNPADDVPSAETEQEERFDADVEDPEQKDQQFIQRRSYQNQRGGGRGGGRRGYPNGRGGRGGRGGGYHNGRGGGGGYHNSRGGGGGYQNGHGGGSGYQNGRGGYYYESGYYQQRSYNNRGRGGRGNAYYDNHGGGSQGGGNA